MGPAVTLAPRLATVMARRPRTRLSRLQQLTQNLGHIAGGQDFGVQAGPHDAVHVRLKRLVAEKCGDQPRIGIYPDKTSGLAEMPECRRIGLGSRPVRRFVGADFIPQTPVVIELTAETRQNAG